MNMLKYLDAILKTRAYDLLWLEQRIEKVDIIAAIVKYQENESVKNLLMQIAKDN